MGSNLNNTELPYNKTNILIQRDDLLKITSVIDEIHNLNVYRRAFVHKSYCAHRVSLEFSL